MGRYNLYAPGHVREWLGLKEVAHQGEAGSGKPLSINKGKAESILKGLTGKTGGVTSIREGTVKLE